MPKNFSANETRRGNVNVSPSNVIVNSKSGISLLAAFVAGEDSNWTGFPVKIKESLQESFKINLRVFSLSADAVNI